MTPPPFLDIPFGAYLSRDRPDPDHDLTLVDPGTPCGEYLRRFWQPVAFARDLGPVPLAVRIMGEDLVLFRDKSGRVGLLERHCTHRGTSQDTVLRVPAGPDPEADRRLLREIGRKVVGLPGD